MAALEYGVVALFLGVYICLIPNLLIKRDLKALKLITLEMMLQNFICIMASDALNNMVSQVIILYKELIFYGATVLYLVFVKKGKLRKSSIPLIMMTVICLPYFMIGDASLYTKLICFRQIMTPVILVLYGRTINLPRNKFNDYIRFIINLGLFQAVFGILEEFVVGDSLWLALHIEKYMDAKGFSRWVYSNGLPGNFYSADLYTFVGMIRRMVGLVADPLLTAHYLAFCIVILLFVKVYKSDGRQYLTMFFLGTCILFTLSKGAILIVGLCVLYKIWKKNKGIAGILAVFMLGTLVVMVRQNTFYTIAIHLSGLTTSIGSSLLGRGLGSAGNYSSLYGSGNSNIGESYIGAIIGQMGLVGLVGFLYIFFSLSKRILRKNRDRLTYSIVAYIIAVIMESFMSESAINFVGSGVAFIALGVLSNVIYMDSFPTQEQYIKSKKYICHRIKQAEIQIQLNDDFQ